MQDWSVPSVWRNGATESIEGMKDSVSVGLEYPAFRWLNAPKGCRCVKEVPAVNGSKRTEQVTGA